MAEQTGTFEVAFVFPAEGKRWTTQPGKVHYKEGLLIGLELGGIEVFGEEGKGLTTATFHTLQQGDSDTVKVIKNKVVNGKLISSGEAGIYSQKRHLPTGDGWW